MLDLEKNLFVVQAFVGWTTGGHIERQDGETEDVALASIHLALRLSGGVCTQHGTMRSNIL